MFQNHSANECEFLLWTHMTDLQSVIFLPQKEEHCLAHQKTKTFLSVIANGIFEQVVMQRD